MHKNKLFRKMLVVGILILFIGISLAPTAFGNIKKSSNGKNEYNEKTSIESINNDEEPKYFNLHEIVDLGQTAWGLTSADFNIDGNYDFAVSWATCPFTHSAISIFYNNGDLEFLQDDVYLFYTSYILDLDSGDFDNDGDIDLIFTYSESIGSACTYGIVNILFNDGKNNFGNETIIAKRGIPDDPEKRIHPHVTSADYDLDGDLDLLVGDYSGMVEFYLNNGHANFTSTGIIHDWGRISYGLCSADFDMDGDIDFLVSAEKKEVYYPLEGYIYLKRNTGLPTCFEHGPGEIIADILWVGGYLTKLDCNNDGDMDIISGTGSVYIFLNEVGTYHQYLVYKLTTFDGIGGTASADYNNDGWDDFVTGGTKGVVRLFINNYNQYSPPPETPTITGPTYGKPGEVYNYTFMTTDPDGDEVYYYIKWQKGWTDTWFGPYESGEKEIISHAWDKKGKYPLKVKAKDIYGGESHWCYLEVTIPRNKITTNLLFFNLLERFPVIEKLLSLIKLNLDT